MHRTIFRFALLLSAAIPLASFAMETKLTVNDPYVSLVPPNSQVSAAFMVIKNAGSTDRKLVKAESPVAKTVELHSHTNENGVMKMREVKTIEITANGQAELKHENTVRRHSKCLTSSSDWHPLLDFRFPPP